MLAHLLANPHLLAGAIVARATVSVAGIIWGIIVLGQVDALGYWREYKPLLAVANEDVIASVLIAIGAINIYRLARWSKPWWPWSIGYAVMAAWWSYALILMLVAAPPFAPTAITGTLMFAALSFIAFISNPRRNGSRSHIE